MEWDFELSDVIDELKKRKITKVFIQLPEGLKMYAKNIMDKLEREGITCALSGDSCYGACDLKEFEDYITIHFGHERFLPDEKNIYVPVQWMGKENVDINIENKKIGILTTVQHIHAIKKLEESLEKKGNEVVIGGTVLGCMWKNVENVKDCDVIIFYGSGVFHALGIAYYLKKEVIAFDPITGRVTKVDWKQWEKEKQIRIIKAKDCESFGIVVSTKPGQKKIDVAEHVINILKTRGKKAYLIIMDEITPEKLDYLPFDCFVITACPRIVLDDWKNYKKPIILPEEIPRD